MFAGSTPLAHKKKQIIVLGLFWHNFIANDYIIFFVYKWRHYDAIATKLI